MEGIKGLKFAWKDGPFLKALKSGDWILLDEVTINYGIEKNKRGRAGGRIYHYISYVNLFLSPLIMGSANNDG